MKRHSMKFNLLASAALLASYSSLAHPLLHGDDTDLNVQCDVEFNKQVNVSPKHVIVIKNDQTEFDIYQDKIIFYKGNQIDLSETEQQLITKFSKQTRAIGPRVTEIALEAIDLTIDALKTGFSDFDNDDELDATLSDLRIELMQKLNTDKYNYTYSTGEFDFDIVDSEFDQTIEDAVEKIVPVIMGSVFQAIGKAMVDGESDLDKLENIGEEIELAVEQRSQDIEIKAEQLCLDLKELDLIERKLAQSNPQLAELDIIKLK